MANKIRLKVSTVPAKVPTTTDLDIGELGLNSADGKLYMAKTTSGVVSSVVEIGANTVNQANIAITGGSINGATIGATTHTTGKFTSLTSTENLTVNGTLQAVNSADATNANGTSGSIMTYGGASIAKKLYVGNNIIATGTVTGSNLSGTNTGDQDLSGKQDLLVSGTNIKTINGTSLLGAGDLTISGSGGSTGNVQVFSTSGTFTWTKPANCTVVHVAVYGGGGGGAAGYGGSGGGGGGGASAARATFNASELASTVSLTVGAGGAAGTSGKGGNGGGSSFGTFLYAYGGAGGLQGGTGGGGASPIVGSTNSNGGAPLTYISGSNSSNGIGGGAGGAGVNPGDWNGGHSVWGGGGGGAGSGNNVSKYGGGSVYSSGGGAGGAVFRSTNYTLYSVCGGGLGGKYAYNSTSGVGAAATFGVGAGGGGAGGAWGVYTSTGFVGYAGGLGGGGGAGGSGKDNNSATAGGAGGGGLIIVISV